MWRSNLLLPLVCLPCLLPAEQRNVLVVIADDLGTDMVPVYQDLPDASLPAMPTLEALMARGVTFTNAWAAPTCSPSRASLITGQRIDRHGVGMAIVGDRGSLDPAAVTLPRLLRRARPDVACGAFGKWHLSGGDADPNLFGFHRFAGSIPGQLRDYHEWERVVDGVAATDTRYATSANVDDALDWLAGLPPGEPWLCWLAFNAPHEPLHAPPPHLHASGDLPGTRRDIDDRPGVYYRAMVEALDHELGRLLDALPPDELAATTIVFLGDNGTPGKVVQQPYGADQAKGTVYQGGVRVPLVIAGAAVSAPGRTCDEWVHATDLFVTVARLFDADPAALLPRGTTIDGVDLSAALDGDPLPRGHQAVTVSQFAPTRDDPALSMRAISDGAFTLLDGIGPRPELYDVRRDPAQRDDLLRGLRTPADVRAKRDELLRRMEALIGDGPRRRVTIRVSGGSAAARWVGIQDDLTVVAEPAGDAAVAGGFDPALGASFTVVPDAAAPFAVQ